MIRPPPSSTLFPTPTLSRSRVLTRDPLWGMGGRASLARASQRRTGEPSGASGVPALRGQAAPRQRESVRPGRSEEHTSELQSLAYLVCRLLLEKKKTCASTP